MLTGLTSLEEAVQRLTSTEHTDETVVQSVCQMWHQMNAKLSPIVGNAGVRALLRRSVLLSGKSYGWLVPSGHAADGDAIDQLCVAFSNQNRGELGAANLLLFQTFYTLLAGLIGESLLVRLLVPVFPTPSTQSGTQDHLS